MDELFEEMIEYEKDVPIQETEVSFMHFKIVNVLLIFFILQPLFSLISKIVKLTLKPSQMDQWLTYKKCLKAYGNHRLISYFLSILGWSIQP